MFGSSSGFERSLPYWSTTVTLSDDIFGIDDETICTIDLTCSRLRTLPSANLTKTDAVGEAESLTNTDLSGIAK